MDIKKNLDAVARDIAIEIHLGGDRFGSEDIAAILEGIPRADLDMMRSRIHAHAEDYYPPFSRYSKEESRKFTEDGIDHFFSAVRTAEDLGRQPGESWFKGVNLRNDRGKIFLLPDGTITECPRLTRESAWDGDGGKAVEESSVDEALQSYISSVMLIHPKFRTPEDLVFMSGDNTVSLEFKSSDRTWQVSQSDTENPLSPLQLFRAVKAHFDSKVKVEEEKFRSLRAMCDHLIDGYSHEVLRDFPLQEVELSCMSLDGCRAPFFLTRDIDELTPVEERYLRVSGISESDPKGIRRKIIPFDMLSPDQVNTLRFSVERTLLSCMERSALTEGVKIEPVVVTFEDIFGQSHQMKANYIFDRQDGQGPMVCGFDPETKNPLMNISVSSLSSKNIHDINRNVSVVMNNLLGEWIGKGHSAASKKSQEKPAKKVRGVE